MDWNAALNIERAQANVLADAFGDWYKDPWGWPEIAWVVKNQTSLVEARLNARGTMRCVKVDVPKENYVTRPALILDALDRLVYQALVDQLSGKLIGDLSSFVYGWRLSRKSPESGRYLSNSKEWEYYRAHLIALSDYFPNGLTTDVVSCFASISIDTLMEDLHAVLKTNKIIERLEDLLRGWGCINGRSGLPQRSLASCVLAHFFLRPIDDVLRRHAKSRYSLARKSGAAAGRWMDDIWIFAKEEARVRDAQLYIQEQLEERGLRINVAKTHAYSGSELDAATREIEHSAADFSLDELDDAGPLEEMLQKIVAEPTESARTTIKFVISRIIKHELYKHVPSIVDVAHAMPHAADAVANLVRISGHWRNLGAWYVDYAESTWGRMSWSVYQMAHSFPADEKAPKKVREFLAEKLEQRTLPSFMLPLVAQRLSLWMPDDARQLIREVAKRTENPFELRAFAYAGLACGVGRSEVRKWLGEFPESDVVLKFLDGNRFKAPKSVS
jgi:hypothetical protein